MVEQPVCMVWIVWGWGMVLKLNLKDATHEPVIRAMIKYQVPGFPGGAVVKNLPANTGAHGFKPWSGKIPRATGQLSPCATTTEPEL